MDINKVQGTSSLRYSVKNFTMKVEVPERAPRFNVGDIVYEVGFGVFAYKIDKIFDYGTHYEYSCLARVTPWSNNPYISWTTLQQSRLVPATAVEIPGNEIKDKNSYLYQIQKLETLIRKQMLKNL